MNLPHAGRGQCWCGARHAGLGAMLAEIEDSTPATRPGSSEGSPGGEDQDT